MKINRCTDELLQLDVNVKKGQHAAQQSLYTFMSLKMILIQKSKQLVLLFINTSSERSRVD